jgi:hypothetical protein
MKPYSLMRAKVASELMRPMFGTFRRLDRADAAVVRGVHVAHLEAGALARQTARPEGREAPLVRHLGERVGLVHELRQLREPKNSLTAAMTGLELIRSCGIAESMSWWTDIFSLMARSMRTRPMRNWFSKQLAHRAHAAVAEVVDVVDAADVLVQAQQVLDDAVEVVLGEGLLLDRHLGVELDVELEAADAREVVALGIEEHAVEERAGALQRRRVAGTHAAVDLDQRLLGVAGGVLGQRVGEDGAGELPLGEEQLDGRRLAVLQPRREVVGHGRVGLEDHLAGVEVDDVGEEGAALELGGGEREAERLARLQPRHVVALER